MEGNLEKDCSAIGALFLTIMQDMRGSSPVWEDFSAKATKLHASLKTTLVAIAGFLDAFQKVADMATGSRGATKELGTALTRLCMRHKAIESKLKRFTGSIMDHLVTPIQEKMEEWKKTVAQLDKDHAKEYKRAKTEIKKCAADTVRLQKKVKKGKSDMQGKLDSAMKDVNDKYILLEESQKAAVRTALIEERARFCLFIACLKPFVDEEVSLLTEVTHLQEIMDSLCMQADAPDSLPPSSEQVIMDLKGMDTGSWNFQTPPSSPSSLGSRKSSMCSISSIASSSSGSTQSHSPSHHNRTVTQNSDNGSNGTDTPEMDSTPSTPSESYPSTPSASSTWTNWPNPPTANSKVEGGRPHTISYASEKSHARPALTQQLFEPPAADALEKLNSTPVPDVQHDPAVVKRERPHSTISSMPYSRPSAAINKMQPVLPPLGPKPKSKAVAPPKVPPIGEQPVYANIQEEIAKAKAAQAAQQMQQQRYDSQDSTDSETTPTARQPPSPSPNTGGFQYPDELVIAEAIRDLDSCTAALHGDFEKTPLERETKRRQNSMELAAAIKALEASTAELQSNYSSDNQASTTSLQCSSGYVTMNSTPATSEDAIATGGIPVSSQAGVLTRRSSLNTPKPPPPVRRSSSITTAPNSAVLQKYRTSPPKQLQPQGQGHVQGHGHPQGQMSVQGYPGQVPQHQQQQYNQHPFQPQHRRSLSASGSGEPAYAELQEIQQSIQARKQGQQSNVSQGSGSGPGRPVNSNAVSAPVTPQYATPVTLPSAANSQNNVNVVNSLNARFAAINNQSNNVSAPPLPMEGDGNDSFDLPPPPTDDELREIEKIYSVPKQAAVSQAPQYQVANQQREHSESSSGDYRQSIISEMKQGSKFRKLSHSDDGTEC